MVHGQQKKTKHFRHIAVLNQLHLIPPQFVQGPFKTQNRRILALV